jgi:hypothetical protein
VVVVVVVQLEFCSTTPYCLLLAEVAEVAEVADSVLDNRHLVQAAKPPTVYMQAKMDKTTPVTVVAVVAVVAVGSGAMAAQSEEVILGAWQDRLGLVRRPAKIHQESILVVGAISTTRME